MRVYAVEALGWLGQYEAHSNSDFEKLTYWFGGAEHPVYRIQPFLVGTLASIDNDASVALEHVVTKEPISVILAKRQFDKDLEELINGN
jgi:hypothetical protein